MAIDLIQLSAALRIGDGVTAPEEPLSGILGRLLGVADAFVALYASTAPDAVKEEATIRMAGYLFDSPTASGSDRYASAWTNSGAGALLSRWHIQRVADAVAILDGPAGAG